MLATFVIGLREGLEAALIVGIVAAFLKRSGTAKDLRRMWFGVAAAVLLCIAVGVGLQLLTTGLPQREQEMLECVIAFVAVAMVTFMIFWMRQHSRGMRAELEGAVSGALARGSSFALVAMAFLAVLREGFETSVFLVAAFQNAASGALPLVGALLGIAVSLVIGWFIYRGAIRFNMGRFFTITAVFLVLVAAGLVLGAFRAAHEAGWLNIGQQPVPGLQNLVTPGSIADAIAGGVFGIRSNLVVIEVAAYLLYAIPMLAVVLWPQRWRLQRRTLTRVLAAATAAFLIIAGAGLLLAPSAHQLTAQQLTTTSAQRDNLTPDQTPGGQITHEIEVTAADLHEAIAVIDGTRLRLPFDGHSEHGNAYVATTPGTVTQGPATLTGAQIASVRGRYPVGLTSADSATAFPATYTASTRTELVLDDASRAVLDYRQITSVNATVTLSTGNTVAVGAISTETTSLTPTSIAAGAHAAATYADQARAHELIAQVTPLLGALMAIILAGFVAPRLRRSPTTSSSESTDEAAPDALRQKESV